jgi:hypothetical protein
VMRSRRIVSRCSPAGGGGFMETYWASRGRAEEFLPFPCSSVAPDVVHDGLEDRRGQACPHDDKPVGVQGAAAVVSPWRACVTFQPALLDANCWPGRRVSC